MLILCMHNSPKFNNYLDDEEAEVEPPANDQYFNQLLEAVPRIIRNRIRGRRQVVVRDDDDFNVAEDSSENEDENLTNENGERFDHQLPTQHSVRKQKFHQFLKPDFEFDYTRKFKKVNFTKIFLTKFHFLQFLKWPEINF